MTKQSIGIFDSGLGGLTVLRALRKALPHEDFIYFGDTANVPYGAKSKQTVTHLSLSIAQFLQTQHVKLIVVACNTASAQALPTLKKQCTVPVLGVIEPGARKALQTTVNNRIAVLGTEGTVRSKAYEKALKKLCKTSRIFTQACPLFVPLVEEGWTRTPVAQLVATQYIKSVRKSKADTVILGCTHYPLLRHTLAEVLGNGVQLVDPADTLAQEVKTVLAKQGNLAQNGNGKICMYASDDPTRFKLLAKRILGERISSVHLKKLTL